MQDQPARPDDAAEIRALTAGLADAWNAGDGAAFAAAFTEDCDYVTFNGERHRGRAAVAESHQRLFDTHLKGSRLFVEEVETRPLDAATMLVHMTGNSALANQEKPPRSRRSIQTLVAVWRDGRWQFAAFHNTRIFEITPLRAILMKLGL